MMRGAWLALPLLCALDAWGCPVCDTGTGAAVRAGITGDFLFGLLATVAPFPFLAAVVAGLHWGWPFRRSS
jgi:hypothetical protein